VTSCVLVNTTGKITRSKPVVRSRDSSVSISLDYWLHDRWFESRQGLEIFFYTTASRPALRPTQPPVKLVPGTLSLGITRPGREADNSPSSNAEVKECMELYHHSLNTPSWRGAHLKKHSDNLNPLVTDLRLRLIVGSRDRQKIFK
jgi:hypothetical protein